MKGVLEAGCDEAGRGPLAGPVFAAAVILPEGFSHPLLDDSKKMSEKNRLLLRDTMAEVGMRNYSKEWWHYFLKNPGTCRRSDFPLLDNMLEQ